MGWQVIIAPSAEADLADIVRYIARHNSDAAARLGYELIMRAENLTAFPEMARGAGVSATGFARGDLPVLSYHLPTAAQRRAD